MEVWIINDFSKPWATQDVMNRVLIDNNGQEDVSLVDTDPSNNTLIASIGLSRLPAIVFLQAIDSSRAVVLDRITDPISESALTSRYLNARSDAAKGGAFDGKPLADFIDVRGLFGDNSSPTPIGFGLLGFGFGWPWWVWGIIAAAAAYKGMEARDSKYLWYAASGVSAYNAIALKGKN